MRLDEETRRRLNRLVRADATLAYLGDRHGLDTVFTLDADFRGYRLSRGRVLNIVP